MSSSFKPSVWIVLLAIASSACQRSSKNETGKSEHATAVTSSTTATETGRTDKWPMPEAMMQHIRNLEQDVRTLETSAEKDHSALALKIGEHTKQLISSCTMDGKAHDALHDWLMPFLQLNKDYAAAPDAATQSAKFKEIQQSLAAFHERFE
jgi:hypothetical protein